MYDYFMKLSLKGKDVRLALFLIMGFIGRTTHSKGTIKLPTKMGTQKGISHQVIVDYVIIDVCYAYNTIVERLLLNSMRV